MCIISDSLIIAIKSKRIKFNTNTITNKQRKGGNNCHTYNMSSMRYNYFSWNGNNQLSKRERHWNVVGFNNNASLCGHFFFTLFCFRTDSMSFDASQCKMQSDTYVSVFFFNKINHPGNFSFHWKLVILLVTFG